MSISISSTSPVEQQLQECETYIRNNFGGNRTFRGTPIAFLSLSAIHHRATLTNITTICDQNPHLAGINWPLPHSRDFFALKVSKHGKRCFAIAIFEELGMLFLTKLMNIPIEDPQLPTEEGTLIQGGFQDDLKRFTANQAFACAPVLMIGQFGQEAPFLRSLPLVKVGTGDDMNGSWVMTFSRGHLRLAADPKLGKYVGSANFFMEVFQDRKEAERE